MQATYTKLRDNSWGVRVEGKPAVGAKVTVKKKSGESKTETIARIVWTDGTISVCAVAQRSSAYGGGGYGPKCPNCRSSACEKAYDLRSLCDED